MPIIAAVYGHYAGDGIMGDDQSIDYSGGGCMTPPDATTLGAWIVGAGAVALALLGLAKLTRAVWRIFRSVSHFLEDWHGSPARPGRDAVPGFPERTEALEKHTEGMCDRLTRLDMKVTAIEHEMHPNSGRSLRDQVDKIVDVTGAEET